MVWLFLSFLPILVVLHSGVEPLRAVQSGGESLVKKFDASSRYLSPSQCGIEF